LDKSTKTTITIHEGEYEFLRLSEIVKHDKYFDTLYEILTTNGEVEYGDYLIKYKRNNYKNKYTFISYDEHELPIRFYNDLKSLAEDYGVTVSGMANQFRRGSDDIEFRGDRIVRLKRKVKNG